MYPGVGNIDFKLWLIYKKIFNYYRFVASEYLAITDSEGADKRVLGYVDFLL